MDELTKREIEYLTEQQEKHEKELRDFKKTMNGKLDIINNKLDGRPSWTIVVIITILSNTVVAFVVSAVSNALSGGG